MSSTNNARGYNHIQICCDDGHKSIDTKTTKTTKTTSLDDVMDRELHTTSYDARTKLADVVFGVALQQRESLFRIHVLLVEWGETQLPQRGRGYFISRPPPLPQPQRGPLKGAPEGPPKRGRVP